MAAARQYRKLNPGDRRPYSAKRIEVVRRAKLRQRYGITPEQYDALLEQQGGCCAICRKPETAVTSKVVPATGERRVKRLAVDHDHQTRNVRGLLCTNCNRSVGMLQEDPELAGRLADYLRTHALRRC